MKTMNNLAPKFYNMVEVEGLGVLIQKCESKDNEFNTKFIENICNTNRIMNKNNIIHNGDYILIRDNNLLPNNINIVANNNTINRDRIIRDFVLKNIDWEFETIRINEENGIYTFSIFRGMQIFENVVEDIKNVLCSNDTTVDVLVENNELVIIFNTNNTSLRKAINKLEHIMNIIKDFYIIPSINIVFDKKYIDHDNIANELDIDVSRLYSTVRDNRIVVAVKCGEYYYQTKIDKYGKIYITTYNKFKAL